MKLGQLKLINGQLCIHIWYNEKCVSIFLGVNLDCASKGNPTVVSYPRNYFSEPSYTHCCSCCFVKDERGSKGWKLKVLRVTYATICIWLYVIQLRNLHFTDSPRLTNIDCTELWPRAAFIIDLRAHPCRVTVFVPHLKQTSSRGPSPFSQDVHNSQRRTMSPPSSRAITSIS